MYKGSTEPRIRHLRYSLYSSALSCINMQEKGALEFKVSKVGVYLRETHSLLTLNYPFGASLLEVYEYANSGQGNGYGYSVTM